MLFRSPLALRSYRPNYISDMEGFAAFGKWIYRNIGCIGKRRYVPDVTVLYISEYDAAGRNKTLIKERHFLIDEEDRIEVPDGETIIYATTAINDGSSHSKLLQLFLRNDAFDDEDYPAISKRIGYFKGTEKGREDMCRAVEELSIKRAKDTRDQIIFNMIKDGLNPEQIAKYTDVTVEYVIKIKENELQTV